MKRNHQNDYDEATTIRCERTLLTLLGDIGPWSDRVYLAGGLAPRYLVGKLPLGVSPHIGTSDVDLVLGLALDDSPETYRTLQANLKASGFEQGEPSFQWRREVDGEIVLVEFLCDTNQVEPGRIYRPKEGTGSKIGAFNVPGAQLATRDFTTHPIQGQRLDDGGISTVDLRVVGILTFVVLKILAFQDRHDNKDAYDLIFTITAYPGGPAKAGQTAAQASITSEQQVIAALSLLAQRFETVEHDGPNAYANFLVNGEDDDEHAQLRNQAVFAVREFLAQL